MRTILAVMALAAFAACKEPAADSRNELQQAEGQ